MLKMKTKLGYEFYHRVRDLEPNNIGTASAPVKIVLVLLLAAAIVGAGFYLFTKNQLADLDKVQAKEMELRGIFETKVQKAANLEEYKLQLEEMRKTFALC